MKRAKIAAILREEYEILQGQLLRAESLTLRIQLNGQILEVQDVAVLLGVWELFKAYGEVSTASGR